MEKHLLLTVSDHVSSAYKLQFIRDFFTDFCQLNLTLFYVSPPVLQGGMDPTLYPEQAALKAKNDPAAVKGRELLDNAWKWITARACDPDKVKKKLIHSHGSKVNEIIEEGHRGMYDSVVLGRRGLSMMEQLVEDSVSHKILWQDVDFPLWVVRNPLKDNLKNVLLCIDGSEPAVHIADHVGFMLGKDQDHDVTILYVKPDSTTVTHEDNAKIDLARIALMDNDYPEERISLKVIQSAKPHDAIIREAEDGKYAVVAVGRRSGAPKGLKRLFPQSVSTKLLHKLTSAALWICK